jgi:hypothetical protein
MKTRKSLASLAETPDFSQLKMTPPRLMDKNEGDFYSA